MFDAFDRRETMDVFFQNRSGARVQTIIANYDPDTCMGNSDQRWRVRAWMTLEPGESKLAFSTTSTTFYYYAEDAVGLGRKWVGRDKLAYIVRGPEIDQCIKIMPLGAQVFGLIEVNTGELLQSFTQNIE